MKTLYKTNENKLICGVCQGLAEYLNVDPTVMRLLWTIFGLTGSGILVYIVAAIIMPEKGEK